MWEKFEIPANGAELMTLEAWNKRAEINIEGFGDALRIDEETGEAEIYPRVIYPSSFKLKTIPPETTHILWYNLSNYQ